MYLLDLIVADTSAYISRRGTLPPIATSYYSVIFWEIEKAHNINTYIKGKFGIIIVQTGIS